MAEQSIVPSVQDIKNAYSLGGFSQLFTINPSEGSPWLHPLDQLYNAFTGQLDSSQISRIAANVTEGAPASSTQDIQNYIQNLNDQGLVGTPGAFDGKGPLNAGIDAASKGLSNLADSAGQALSGLVPDVSNPGSIFIWVVLIALVAWLVSKVV